MARKPPPAERTQQVNFRLKTTTVERMERFRDAHPIDIRLTAIVEAAVNEWLDRAELDARRPKKP